jgi:hypothetical protein
MLVGGGFDTLGGQWCGRLGRLNPGEAALQTLSCDGTTVRWLRGGTSPEVWRASFAASTNGANWTPLGDGARIAGGWQLTGLSLSSNVALRARGYVTGGDCNGSSWFVDTLLPVFPLGAPAIRADAGFWGGSNQFGFNVWAVAGQILVVETSSNLLHWSSCHTNAASGGVLNFLGASWTNRPASFYRARLWP